MKIFKDNIELVDLVVSDESYRYRTIMGENALTLTFSLNTFIEIPVGAYADFQGERYTLLVPQNFKKNDSRNFEYTLILESSKSLLGRYKFRDSSTKKLKFSTTAKPIEHLEVLVWNLNQRDSGWSVGECIDSTEKLLSFNHTYCDEVLKMIAEAFNTEYEIVGKVISLKKVEYNKSNPLALSYGFGNGFKSGVKRDNFNQSKAIEVLYVQGGEKNIDSTAYGSSELLLPKNQTLVYQGRSYISDENGYSIKRADKPLSTYIEDSLDLSNIYPSRVGVISEVVTVNSDKNFYDIKDSSIPESLNYTDCLVKGETMTIIFQTGMLTGKEFDVSYNHTSRKFEIIPQEIDGVTMPSSVFIPVVGDKYVVFGMSLPEAYVCDNTTKTGASWDMFLEAVKYFFDNEDPRFSFTGDLDGIWAKKDWLNIGGKIILGGFCAFTDEQFQNTPVLIRMVGIKDYINDPHYPQIELSNVTVGNTTSSQIKSIPTKDVLIEDSKKDSIRFAKRGFRDAKQTTEMLQSALLNFSSSISPLTVQTMQLIAGDETLQFEFVASSTSTTSVAHNESYNPATKQFSSAAGVLQHKTLGVTTLSSSHAATELKWWNMTAFVSAVLDESSKSYYLYAKVSKTANTGVFLLSETAISLESVAGYYHLLMGILNSENDGDRSYSQMYGYSELTPARMTVKKVVSPSGNTFFDLENEVIQGNIKFQSGVAVETGISNAKGEAISTAATDATNKANNAIQTSKEYSDAKVAVINQSLADLQTQSDGAVSNWPSNTQTEAPTLSNFPASQWTSNTERDRHILDVYTNYQEYVSDAVTPNAGKSWKFVKSEAGVYSWSLIADNNQSKAYLMSVKATAIANQKITTFSAIPNTLMADGFCYRKGDLWSLQAPWNGFTVGELLSASQDSTSFVSSDWTKWVKYTDDTAVTNMKIGGRNLYRNGNFSNGLDFVGDIFSNGTIREVVTDPIFGHAFKFSAHTRFRGFVLGGIKAGDYITISFWIKSTTIVNGAVGFSGIGNDNASKVMMGNSFTPITSSWQRVISTQQAINDEYAEETMYILSTQDDSNPLFITNIQFEIGNKVTDWTPAIEDIAADATAKANAAQAAAISTAAVAAQTKADLAELNAKAHADGIVTAEEQRAINDATTKANNAQTAAINAAAADATAKANAAQAAAISTAAVAAQTKADLAELNAKAHADGIVTAEEQRAINDATTKANNAQTAAINAAAADATAKANAAQASATAVANAAQSTANSAVSAAATANSLIADMASDDIISPSEKPALLKEWLVIVTEKPLNLSQAYTFAITTTAYSNAYDALNTFIGSNLNDVTTSWALGSGNGSVLRVRFNSYYTERTNLLNSIATKGKDLAIAAQSTVDNLQVGGRNLYRNGDYSNGLFNVGGSFGDGSIREVINDSTFGKALRVSSNIRLGQPIFAGIKQGELLTFSFYAKATTPYIINFVGVGYDSGNPIGIGLSLNKYFSLSTSWNRFTITWAASADQIDGQNFYFYLPGGDSNPIYFANVQLERGNRATDWKMAVEDDYVKNAIKGSASINGGLVLGNVMAVTDENGNVMAGMNGLAGAQYPIWSGAADAANANFSVDKYGNIKANGGAVLANGAISYNSDGTGQIGNGAMTWDALKRLIVNMTNFKIDVNGNVSVYGNLLQQSTSFAIDSLSKSLSVTNFAYRCQRVYGYHASPAVFTLSFPAGIVNGTRFSMYINNRIVVDGSGTNVSVSSYLLVNSNINLIYKNGVNGGQGNIIIAANSMAILEGVYVSDSLGIGTNTPSFVLGTMTVMTF